MEETGILYGVSVGPGDPELITLKALQIVRQTEVIATPMTCQDKNRALDIISGLVDLKQKELLFLEFPMSRDEKILRDNYIRQADKIMAKLALGYDVAMLNIGDTSIYGTYGYIRDIVRKQGFTTVTIPGVPSFCAVAAALNTSLAEKNEVLMVIPGDCENIEALITGPGNKILMKSGKGLGRVRKLISEKGLDSHASLVANCGLPNEKIFEDITQAGDEEGYFTTVFLKHD